MSQISPPIRVVLVAALAFLAAWMLVLRPKSEAATPSPAPAATATAKQPGTTAQSAAGKAVQAAANAKASAESAAKARAGESTAPATTASAARAPSATPAPAALPGVDPAALRTLPRDVRKAIVARKIVVIGFFNRKAADDRSTRKELAHASRWHGRVSVHTASIASVQRYQVITRGVDVAQSPAIVVIDRDREAELLTGYVDRVTIDQAILDALRRSGVAVIKSPYLRKVNELCGANGRALNISFQPTSTASLKSWVRHSAAAYRGFVGRFDRLEAPASLRAFKTGMSKDLHVETAALGAVEAALQSGSLTRLRAVGARYDEPLAAAGKRIQARARQHDLLACTYD